MDALKNLVGWVSLTIVIIIIGMSLGYVADMLANLAVGDVLAPSLTNDYTSRELALRLYGE